MVRPGCTVRAVDMPGGPLARAWGRASSSRAAEKQQAAAMPRLRPFIACQEQNEPSKQAAAASVARGGHRAIQQASSEGLK